MITQALRKLSIALLVVALSAGCSQGPPTVQAASITPAPSTAEAAELSPPAQAYMDFNQALLKADSLEDITPYLAQEQVNQIAQVENPDSLLPVLKSLAPSTLSFTNEEVTGNRAVLHAKATVDTSPSKADIVMLKEQGRWKLLEENWGDLTEER
jgi:hypothetical protein